MKRILLLLALLWTGQAYAQSCNIAPAPNEGFCSKRTPFYSGSPADFIVAWRVNASAKCVSLQFDNYYTDRPKLTHWFTTKYGPVRPIEFARPGEKVVVPVATVNAWTSVLFFVHRGSCSAPGQLLAARFYYPVPGHAIGRSASGPASGMDNRIRGIGK